MIAIRTVAGAALTWARVGGMSAMFFVVASVKSFEPAVLFSALALLASRALAACYGAARRALGIVRQLDGGFAAVSQRCSDRGLQPAL